VLIVKKGKKRKSRHPFAFTTLLQDSYFPRTNIPRPWFKDVREHPHLFNGKKIKYPFSSRRLKKRSRYWHEDN